MSSNQLDKKAQAWSALFSEPMSELVKRYTASVDFDKRLWRADIQGSLAHAEMLSAQGIIGANDYAAIQGFMLTVTTIYILLNWAIDILYSVIDPRVRV